MSSPLVRRFPRELRGNLGKYFGIFLMMTVSIAFVSGFLLSASSIQTLGEGIRDRYHVEDGRFISDFEINTSALRSVERLGMTVYPDFSYDLPLVIDGRETHDNPITVRLYANRSSVNLAAYAEGQAPAADDEIALDRVFMNNNDLHIGDTVSVDGRPFRICGTMSLPDYQSLFVDNDDFLFNALTFSVAQVTPGAHEGFRGNGERFSYSFVLDDRGMSRADRADLETRLAERLADKGVVLDDLIDADDNQGITYALDDVEGDQAMWIVLQFMLILIMAFVFVVLTGATIEQESAVIGTLLASGYRKGELLRHYLTLPAVIGAIASLLGLLLGVTVLAGPMQGLYYNSYGLPPYEAHFNPRVILFSVVLPFVMLVTITFIGLSRKLQFTPLQFLRHEVTGKGLRRMPRFPERMGYVNRFRLRVLFRNASHFVTLFFGIMFASLLLLFGFCLMPTVAHYAESLSSDMVSEHRYILKAPVEIDGSDSERRAYAAAERIATAESMADILGDEGMIGDFLLSSTIVPGANRVNTLDNTEEAIAQAEKIGVAQLGIERKLGGRFETVSVYGIQEGSRYWPDIDVSDGRVVVGKGVLEKTKVKVGQPVELKNKVTDDRYVLTPTAATSSRTDLSVYMSLDTFNGLFDNDDGYFNGYVSDEPLNIDARYVANDLTPDAMLTISTQLEDSLGDIISMIVVLAVPIYLILIFLLTKTVIDRSARAISYMKVFGYHDDEVGKLYIRSITVAVVISLFLSLPLVYGFMVVLVKVLFMFYSGNFPLTIPMSRFALVILCGTISYALVAVLHLRRIRKVPFSLALKVQE